MNETYFIDEDTFFERIFEFVKNGKEFKFYVNDGKDNPKFFKSSYKHESYSNECERTFLFTEFGESWLQLMLWEDIDGNPITWNDIKKRLLNFISDHTLHERVYYLDDSQIK